MRSWPSDDLAAIGPVGLPEGVGVNPLFTMSSYELLPPPELFTWTSGGALQVRAPSNRTTDYVNACAVSVSFGASAR